MTAYSKAVLAIVASAALAGCVPQFRRSPPPISAAPSQPVRMAELPPPVAPAPVSGPEAPIADAPLPGEDATAAVDGTQVAALPAPTQTVAVGRTDLLGGWSIASGGETCQLFMSLTTWTGGYRASTRGCSSPTLAGISAWDLSGSTVTLKGGDGATTVATLAATSPSRFTGTTAGGGAVTVAR